MVQCYMALDDARLEPNQCYCDAMSACKQIAEYMIVAYNKIFYCVVAVKYCTDIDSLAWNTAHGSWGMGHGAGSKAIALRALALALPI